jgi:hypothetical protein
MVQRWTKPRNLVSVRDLVSRLRRDDERIATNTFATNLFVPNMFVMVDA